MAQLGRVSLKCDLGRCLGLQLSECIRVRIHYPRRCDLVPLRLRLAGLTGDPSFDGLEFSRRALLATTQQAETRFGPSLGPAPRAAILQPVRPINRGRWRWRHERPPCWRRQRRAGRVFLSARLGRSRRWAVRGEAVAP